MFLVILAYLAILLIPQILILKMLKKLRNKIENIFIPSKIVQQQYTCSDKFDKDKVFDDYLFNYSPLSFKQILGKYNSFLLEYKINYNVSLIDYLDMVCQKFNVNPKLILVLLEKYYGLVKSTNIPTKEVLNYALDIGKGMTQSLHVPKFNMMFEGIDKQIHFCAMYHRRWFDQANGKIDIEINCTDGEIRPQNAFTYALYMCDPYVGEKDLYKKNVVKDQQGTPIEEGIKNVRPLQPFKYLMSFISDKYMVKVKMYKQDIKLVKKAPFGVYKTYKIWEELFNP